MLFQQITGQPSVLYYAAKIFKDAGFASDADATRVSVVLGFFKLIMTGETVLAQVYTAPPPPPPFPFWSFFQLIMTGEAVAAQVYSALSHTSPPPPPAAPCPNTLWLLEAHHDR